MNDCLIFVFVVVVVVELLIVVFVVVVVTAVIADVFSFLHFNIINGVTLL